MERSQNNALRYAGRVVLAAVFLLAPTGCAPQNLRHDVIRDTHCEIEIRYHEPAVAPAGIPDTRSLGEEKLTIPPASRLTPQDVLPVEGMLVDVKFRIKNISRDYLMLVRLRPHDPSETEFSWQFDFEGVLQYKSEEDAYLFQKRPWTTTPPYFNGGLLAPGEKISLPIRTRALSMPRNFTLEYLVFTTQDLLAHVYTTPSGPAQETIRFQKIAKSIPTDSIGNPDDPGPTRRTVIYPPSILKVSSAMNVPIDIPMHPNPISPGSALTTVGAPSNAPHTYFEAGQGWIIHTPSQAWYVGKTGPSRIPSVPLPMFFMIDVSARKIEIEFPDNLQETLQEQYKPVTLSDAGGKKHVMLYLEPPEVIPFLIFAWNRGLQFESALPSALKLRARKK